MSGQGAMLTISNRCPTSINVRVAGDGMNTLPPQGDISAGGTNGPAYVEAAFFGSSSFNLEISGITIPFKLDGWAYFVNGGTQYQALANGKLINVSIQQRGKGAQDGISVLVVPLPTSSAGKPSAPIYRMR